jgi:hypothetical protein
MILQPTPTGTISMHPGKQFQQRIIASMYQLSKCNIYPRYSPAPGVRGNSNPDFALVIASFQGGCIVRS